MDKAMSQEFTRIGGFAVSDGDYDGIKQRIEDQIQSRSRLAVFFANAHFVVTCQPLCQRLSQMASVLILNDGVGVSLARRLLGKGKFAENMNGTDFIPRLLRESTKPLRVYLLGSAPASVEGAAEAFGRIPHVDIVGSCDGYSMWQDESGAIKDINEAQPDILLVALGCPLQESWIIENFDRLDASVIFGVGALFDFMSGRYTRAPRRMRAAGFEWLYRMWCEPRRLYYRYTLEVFTFFRIVLAGAFDTVQPVVRELDRRVR